MKSEVRLTNSGTLVLIVQATANLVLVLKPMLKQKKNAKSNKMYTPKIMVWIFKILTSYFYTNYYSGTSKTALIRQSWQNVLS